MAMQSGGIDTTGRPNDTGDYGPFLGKLNFNPVPGQPFVPYIPVKGDIAVFDKNDIHTHGHVTGFDGAQWVSDFVQRQMNPYVSPSTGGVLQIYRSGNPCQAPNYFPWLTY
jgi:hypothetical protein